MPELIPLPNTLVQLQFTKEQSDRFFSALGRCISEWARIDRLLFDLCEFILETDEHVAAVIYYRIKTLGGRKSLAIDLAKAKLKSYDNKVLEPIWKCFDDNIWLRNAIAHYPTQVTMEAIWDLWADGGPRVIKQESYAQSITEPKEVLKGSPARSVAVEDMEAHIGVVQKLHSDLSTAINIFKYNATSLSKILEKQQKETGSRSEA